MKMKDFVSKLVFFWNMIRYEGQWKHVDVTMGYPCFWSLTGPKDTWGGYNKTAAELSRSHKLYHPEILPTERQKRWT